MAGAFRGRRFEASVHSSLLAGLLAGFSLGFEKFLTGRLKGGDCPHSHSSSADFFAGSNGVADGTVIDYINPFDTNCELYWRPVP